MRSVLIAALVAALSGVASPAQQQRFVWHEIPGATATAVALLWQQGYDEESVPGAAAVLAECRLLRARAAVPALLASGQLVTGDATVIFGLVGGADPAAPAAFVQALLDDEAPLADDTLALVVARAALAADDVESVYPGTTLEAAARRRLLVGAARRAPAGDAAAIAKLQPAVVRARLREPVLVGGGALGAASAAARASLAAVVWPALPAAPPGPRAPVAALAAAPSTTMPVATHPRIDGPFVAAAFVAPPPAEWPVFAVAVEILRARASRRLRLRGPEVLGRAPLVRWSWLEAEPLLLCCRRGRDGEELLPGQVAAADAAAEAGAARRELEDLLVSLRDEPPTAAEVAAAVRLLYAELSLPGGEALHQLGRLPRALPGRLQTWLLVRQRGIDVDALSLVTPAMVAATLAASVAAERAAWFALVPVARADRGWVPR